jgi:hypothetical protein
MAMFRWKVVRKVASKILDSAIAELDIVVEIPADAETTSMSRLSNAYNDCDAQWQHYIRIYILQFEKS